MNINHIFKGLAVCTLLVSNTFATPDKYPSQELFQVWDSHYKLVSGSRACKQNLELSYVNNPHTNSHYLSATSENYQDYPNYLIENLPGENFEQTLAKNNVFKVVRNMYGLHESQDTQIVHTHSINEFTDRLIDMDVEFGNNNYNLVLQKTRNNQVLLKIDDHANVLERIKGVISVERVRQRQCKYKNSSTSPASATSKLSFKSALENEKDKLEKVWDDVNVYQNSERYEDARSKLKAGYFQAIEDLNEFNSVYKPKHRSKESLTNLIELLERVLSGTKDMQNDEMALGSMLWSKDKINRTIYMVSHYYQQGPTQDHMGE